MFSAPRTFHSFPKQNLSHFGPTLCSRTFATQKKILRLVLIGSPGSGKGTQASSIQQDFGVIPISTGDILRNVKPETNPLHLEVSKQLASGGLVGDDLMLELVKKSIADTEAVTKGWILDGYPRNPKQALQLEELLSEVGQSINVVFYLKVTEQVIFNRLKDRWVHLPSGRVYNTEYKPPKVPGIDDITGEPLVKRSDDSYETIAKRVKAYHDSTLPVLNFYENIGKLVTIEAPTSKEGYVPIRTVLKNLLYHEPTPTKNVPQSLQMLYATI